MKSDIHSRGHQQTSERLGNSAEPAGTDHTRRPGKGDITSAITKVGTEIDDLLHPDTHNLFAGAVSLQQPVFMGGKIVNANRMAKLAEELSRAQYDKEYQDLLTTVDQAYWQVVSVSNKKRLAENFADLLEKWSTM